MSSTLQVLFWTLFFVGYFTQSSYVASASSPTIGPALVASLFNKATVNIILSFQDKARQKQTLSSLASQSFPSRTERLNAVANTLKESAAQSQARVLAFLDAEKEKQGQSTGISVESLWITNQVVVWNARADLVHRLGKMPEISRISEDQIFKLEDPVPVNVSGNDADAPSSEAQWGVVRVGAPLLWEQGIRGQGIVVGIIDTGVRHTHDELRDNFVGPYGWFDPYNKSSTPYDDSGHGTHTTGTIIGNGPRKVGVAPDSKWMFCNGCAGSCSEAAVIACGQWMVCPTDPQGNNPDCSKAPHVVSSSWVHGYRNRFYEQVIEAYHTAHIIPVFAAGNCLDVREMGRCSTMYSPAEYANVIAVGASLVFEDQDFLTYFSCIGPSAIEQSNIKPDVVAPGFMVTSASAFQDDGYLEKSGTSMATPHVAGVVALLLSEYGNLTYSDIKTALEQGSVPTNSSGRPTCNGLDGTTFPNYHSGYGRVDAVRSLDVLRKMFPKK